MLRLKPQTDNGHAIPKNLILYSFYVKINFNSSKILRGLPN